MSPSEPEELRKLGDRLDAVERRVTGRGKQAPQTSMGIAFRFSTELVSALIVGGALGWGIDWAADRWSPVHTRPLGLILFFVLGAAAGILNVIRAARQINAEMARNGAERGD
jgi:ATP synthase protein I